jgi:hypothetical protein
MSGKENPESVSKREDENRNKEDNRFSRFKQESGTENWSK